MLTITVGNFAQYLKAEFVVGSIMFAIVTVGMFAVGVLRDAPLLGLIALVMELIPQIGAILALPVASIVRYLFRHFFDKAVADDLVYDEVEPLEGVSGAWGDPGAPDVSPSVVSRSSCMSKTVLMGSRRPVRNHARRAPPMPAIPLIASATTTPSR